MTRPCTCAHPVFIPCAPCVHLACTPRPRASRADVHLLRTHPPREPAGQQRQANHRAIFRRSGFPSGGPCLGYSRPSNVTGVTCAASTCAASDARGEFARAPPAPPPRGDPTPRILVSTGCPGPRTQTHAHTHTHTDTQTHTRRWMPRAGNTFGESLCISTVGGLHPNSRFVQGSTVYYVEMFGFSQI